MKILILNTAILAINVRDDGTQWATDDQIIPKHVAPSAVMVDAELPDDYAPGRYTFDGGFVRVPEPVLPRDIPASISPRQLRQALTATGLRSAVEEAIAAADQDTKDWYEFAIEVERSHPMVNAMADGLGVTQQQLDDLFTLAGSL